MELATGKICGTVPCRVGDQGLSRDADLPPRADGEMESRTKSENGWHTSSNHAMVW